MAACFGCEAADPSESRLRSELPPTPDNSSLRTAPVVVGTTMPSAGRLAVEEDAVAITRGSAVAIEVAEILTVIVGMQGMPVAILNVE